MAYSLSSRGMTAIRDHAHAEQIWLGLSEFPPRHRGSGWNFAGDLCEARPLDDAAREKGTRSLRKRSDGSWAARYHDTDVVVFHANGDVEFEPWDSISTNAFVEGVAPPDFHAQFTASHAYVLWVKTRTVLEERLVNGFEHQGEFIPYGCDPDEKPRMETVDTSSSHNGGFAAYEIDRGARFRRGDDGFFQPVEGTSAIDVPHLDQSQAARMRRSHDIDGFFAWFNMRRALDPQFVNAGFAIDDPWDGVAAHLARGPDQYLKVAKVMHGHGRVGTQRLRWGHSDSSWSLPKFKRAVLSRLYNETGCVTRVPQPCYADAADYARVRKLCALYDI